MHFPFKGTQREQKVWPQGWILCGFFIKVLQIGQLRNLEYVLLISSYFSVMSGYFFASLALDFEFILPVLLTFRIKESNLFFKYPNINTYKQISFGVVLRL